MTTHLKGLIITTMGALFVVPDSLFVRLIGAEALVISFWRGLISGLVILLAVLVLQGTSPFRAVLQTGRYGIIYILAAGVSGMLFVLAVSMTSIANVVFIIATLPVFAAIYSHDIPWVSQSLAASSTRCFDNCSRGSGPGHYCLWFR